MSSSIPQSASALRKPSMRPSLAPNSFSAPRQSLAVAPSRTPSLSSSGGGGYPYPSRGEGSSRSSIRRSVIPGMMMGGPNGGRKGAPPPPPPIGSSLRGSSRPSSFGVGLSTPGMYSTSVGTASTRDPRPLRDREYLASISQHIFQYLTENGFEIATKHQFSMKTLKMPTQKDFVLIFQFLYRKLDPGYRFTRSMDVEVYNLMRSIHYPYVDSINKSAITAVGGNNVWPTFLGLLYWLVQLNEALEAYDNREENLRQEPEDVVLDRIFMRYVSKSYRAFLASEDDYSEYKAEMEQDFVEYTADMEEQIKGLEEENAKLRERAKELAKETSKLNNLVKKREALESDLVKFKAYIDSMETRKQKWTSVLDRLKAEVDSADRELQQVNAEKESIQQQISSQGLSPADIDRMNSERDKLGQAIEYVNTRLEEVQRIVREKEHNAQRALDGLEKSLHAYNSALYRVGLTAIEGIDFSVSLDNPLADENLGQRPEALVKHKDIRGTLRPALQQHRQTIHSRMINAQDETLRLTELLDQIHEAVNEKSETRDTKQAQLNTEKMSYAELYDNIQSDASASNAEIERLERQITITRNNSEQGLFQISSRSQSVKIELQQLRHSIDEARTKMNAELESMISAIIDFKVHIQSALIDYELFVLDEHERDE
ncbi:kinetochore protein Ndc80p [Trichomonascus vanleenenianus]|uniref:kinetochore-associated Ndc80 complex subunit NDC80 n=1 Tax=Trichomonascus vanleenenianus TaxID=2268995 RepID=UPI003EC985A9